MRQAQRIALLATLLVATFGVGTAKADWQTDRAQAIAAKLWNNPCNGQVTLWYTTPPQPNWRAWTYVQLCTIGMSNSKPWKWDELCPVLMHEYGHLAGYRDPLNPKDPTHSHDPADIMWPFEHYDARCDDYGSAFLGVPRPPEAPQPVQKVGAVGRAAGFSRRSARKRRALKPRGALSGRRPAARGQAGGNRLTRGSRRGRRRSSRPAPRAA